MSLRINSDFNGVTDPDAGRYIAAVEAADGQLLEFGVGKAINDFVVGCKQDRIWDAIKASCILAGARTLAGALVPLAGTAPTNVGGLFVSGDYNRKTGLVGNGSSKYLDSNRNFNADPASNFHYSAYGSVSGFTGIYMGANGTNDYRLLEQTSGGVARFNTGNTAGNFSDFTNSPASIGLYAISRASTTAATVRFAQSSRAVSTTAGSLANRNAFVFCRNSDGTAANFSGIRLAFYSIGESLDLALLDARVTALITAFGVAIP
jgi:hypothetical protein